MSDKMFRPIINDIREGMLDLSPLNTNFLQLIKGPFPVTHGFSPSVIPKPKDWNAARHISAYWFFDEDYESSNKFSG
jgi:hypothetical protein